jgi:hypothetical protein
MRALPNLGKYQLLYVYLRDRFANRVVMTFGEIEALLGTELPEAARHEPAWWSTADDAAAASEQADSWTSANRRAEVNFAAQRVVFDRDETLGVRPQTG